MVRAKILTLAGAAALVSTASLAADLPPPLLPPPPAPVVVTGGWYLRGDIGLINMYEHHHSSEQEPGRVSQVLTGTAGSRAMDGFKHGTIVTDICRARKANRARDLGRYVGENISVEVGHDDNIECLWRIGKFGGSNIDDPVFAVDIWVFRCNLIEHFMKQAVS